MDGEYEEYEDIAQALAEEVEKCMFDSSGVAGLLARLRERARLARELGIWDA